MIDQRLSAKFYLLVSKALLSVLLCIIGYAATAQLRDAFKLRGPGGLQSDPNTCIFSLHGDFTMIANVNLWAASGADDQTRVNNGTNMVRVDLDGLASTTNSSMSELKLYSTCSKIVYAGLYWTADVSSGTTDARKKSIKIRGPKAGDTYYPISAPMYSRLPGDGNQYVCFSDVTAYVQQQGVGQYWVADMALTEGSDSNVGNYAGWGMVVIYEDAALPMRNIAMFDGYAYVSGGSKYTIPVSGFKSVQTGPVKVKLGFMAGEGDAGYTGDWCQMRKATAVGNVNTEADWISLESPATPLNSQNFWRSRVSNDGGAARNPNKTNNLGFDAFVFTADNTNNQFIGNNQTSSAIRYGSDADQYVIFNMVMAVDAYEPNPVDIVQVSTGGVYVDHNTVSPDQVLTYKIDVTNQGNEAVLNNKLEIPIPYNAPFVPGSITTTFDASLSGASASYDPAGQKIVVNLGTLPVAPTNNLNKVFASITFQLKATTDCYYLKNSVSCLRDISIQGTITGTGATTGVTVNKKTIAGYQGGDCSQTPITTPTTSTIVVPPSYTACDSWQPTTLYLRICPGTATSITATTVRSLLTLPNSITYVFNSKADGTGTVYNDNNPFPITSTRYYAVPVNTIDANCSASIPFDISILSVTTPPTVTSPPSSFCPSALPYTLVATATAADYSVFWYTQATGGTASGSATIAANTTPGTYTYYVAQGYDASCQSSRTAVTITVNATPSTPLFNGANAICGGADSTYYIVSPNANYTYEWALDNAPVGITFKNGTATGTSVVLTQAPEASGTFTIKVRAKDNSTNCTGDYRSLSVTVSPQPAKPNITGNSVGCAGSVGNMFTVSSPIVGTSYEWAYSGTNSIWAHGANTGQSVELQLQTGATGGNVSVRAKSGAGCYSDAATQTFAVRALPADPSSMDAPATICVGQMAELKINDSQSSLSYQIYDGGNPVGTATAGNGGVLTIEVGPLLAAGNRPYTIKTYDGLCYSPGTIGNLVVLDRPVAPVVAPGVAICNGTQPMVQVLNAVVDNTYKVYDNMGLTGNTLATVVATSTPQSINISDNPTANTTYYITSSNSVCASEATAVSVTVRNQVTPPTTLSAAEICPGQKPSIVIGDAPMTSGLFDNTIYQYKVYSDDQGATEITPVTSEQISSTAVLITPNTTLAMGTHTLYVGLVANGCASALSSVSVVVSSLPAPLATSKEQCLNTPAVITLNNTVAGHVYRVYDGIGATSPLTEITSAQSGSMDISLAIYDWGDGTTYYVEEALRNEGNTADICTSNRTEVTMLSGTPADLPSFVASTVYTCSDNSATVTLKNTLAGYTYTIYDANTGGNIVASFDCTADASRHDIIVNYSGSSATYWMEMEGTNSGCSTARVAVTINYAVPATPTVDASSVSQTVCRGTTPTITITNAVKDNIYTLYDAASGGTVVEGPVTAIADGTLTIPITGVSLSGGQTEQVYLEAKAPALQNSCASSRVAISLTDGEPTMPALADITAPAVCHGSPITVSIANVVSGYTYRVYDAANNMVGIVDNTAQVTLNNPNISNPSSSTDLPYRIRVQSATCVSQSTTDFTVKVNRTVEAGSDFTIGATTICSGDDAVINVQILNLSLSSASDLTLKWYSDPALTNLVTTQTPAASTSSIDQTFSNLTTGNYTYYLTVESASAGLCPNKAQNAGVATIIVRPRATFYDVVAQDAVICHGGQTTLTAQLENSSIINPVYNWYTDAALSSKVGTGTTFTSPALTANTTYYITVQGDNYCENRPNDGVPVDVNVVPLVATPSVAVVGNATALCLGDNLVLKLTPIGSISGYELWESGILMQQPSQYVFDSNDSTSTVLAPASGTHTYSAIAYLVTQGITCKSDTAKASIVVNDPINPPSISSFSTSVCQGDETVFALDYGSTQPNGYIIYDGSGVQDASLYDITNTMHTVTLHQPVVGHHDYTVVALAQANGITCLSPASATAANDLYPHPTVTISNTGAASICTNEQAQLTLTLVGTAPFTYTVQAVDIHNNTTYLAQDVQTNDYTITLAPAPDSTTTYRVTALSDAHCDALPVDLAPSVTITVYADLNAGTLLPNDSICNNTSPGDLSVSHAFGGNTATGYTYTWAKWNGSSFDAIASANAASYNPGTLATGVHTYRRTVTDGCQTLWAETTITVTTDLQAGTLIANTTVCSNTSPGELNTAPASDGKSTANSYSYTWEYSTDGVNYASIPGATTVEYTPGNLATGTHYFRRTATDDCQTATTETTITVLPALQGGSLIAPTSVCVNTPVGELSATLPSGGRTDNYAYSWQLWDGSNFVNLVPPVTTATYSLASATTGTYRYQRTVADGCQTATAETTINVYSDVSPGALLPDTVICNNGSPGNLSRQSAEVCGGTSNIAYHWYTSTDGSTWTSISHTSIDYTPGNLTTGVYYYKREVTDGSTTVSVAVKITVLDDVQGGSLIAPTSVCVNQLVGELSATLPSGGNTTNYTYSWQLWDGSSFVDLTPTITAPTYDPASLPTGTYRYQRTVTDGCRTATAETTVTVLPTLQGGSLIANTSVCVNTSVGNLNATLPSGGQASNYTYSWQLWNSSAGEYVELIPTTQDYAPGVLSIVGNYQYQRTVTDGCQTATASVIIGVYSDVSPGTLLPDTVLCNNSALGSLNRQEGKICGGSSPAYNWYTSTDGMAWTSLSSTNVDYTPGTLSTGVYYYKREVTDGTTTVSAATKITVLDDLHGGSLIADATLCNHTSPGALNTAEASGGNVLAYAYTWEYSTDGVTYVSIVSATTAQYNPGSLTTGTHYYRRTITDGCQTRTAQTTITVATDLQAGSLVSPIRVAYGTTVGNLNATTPSGGKTTPYTYTWQHSTNGVDYQPITSATTADYSPGTLPIGTHYFRRLVSDDCSVLEAATQVIIYSSLDAGTLIVDCTICANTSPGNLNSTYPTGDHYSCTWQRYNGTAFEDIPEAGTSPDYTPSTLQAGNYRYQRTTTDGYETKVAEVSITVSAAPPLTVVYEHQTQGGGVSPITPTDRITLGSPLLVKVEQDDYTQYTFVYDGHRTEQASPEYVMYHWNPKANNKVDIAVVDHSGCANASSFTFVGPEIDLPNIITPNHDGHNDRLLPGYDLEVFNRWGSRLYSGTDGWDGTYAGANVAAGTYFYIVHLPLPDGTTHDVKYHVLVKR